MLTSNEFLRELHLRGATRISRVTFRMNRSIYWSLTRNGTALNVHVAFRAATPPLLDAFATLAREGGIGSRRSRRAAELVGSWPALEVAILEAHQASRTGCGHDGPPTHCCATREQRRYLRALYRYLNRTRFGGALPDDVPVRLSRRMKSALGHMLPGQAADGSRLVIEIALNVDLMLPANGAERIDTLLHEMAHAADYLESGARGHGASWRAWATRVGCQPTTLYERPVASRRRRSDPVDHVPPLPQGIRSLAD